jgi:hypothetical protein
MASSVALRAQFFHEIVIFYHDLDKQKNRGLQDTGDKTGLVVTEGGGAKRTNFGGIIL